MTNFAQCAQRIAVVLMLLSLPNAATAAIMSQNVGFNIGTPDARFSVENDNGGITTLDDSIQTILDSLTFDQFDQTMFGPLTGVMISFDAQLLGALGVSVAPLPGSSTDEAFTVTNDGTLTLQLGTPGGPLMGDVTQGISCGIAFSGNPPQCDDSAGILANRDGMLTALGLAPFIGNGQFDIDITLTSMIALSSNPDNGTDFIDNATTLGTLANAGAVGSVTVTYEYVPEPGVLLLLLAGLGGLVTQLRRR